MPSNLKIFISPHIENITFFILFASQTVCAKIIKPFVSAYECAPLVRIAPSVFSFWLRFYIHQIGAIQ